MEITANEPTAGKVAGIEITVIEVASVEKAVLEGDLPKRLFLGV
jgi:hypothetical protein